MKIVACWIVFHLNRVMWAFKYSGKESLPTEQERIQMDIRCYETWTLSQNPCKYHLSCVCNLKMQMLKEQRSKSYQIHVWLGHSRQR